MSDIEERVINMIEKRDSIGNLKDGLTMLKNIEPDDRDEFTDRLTAEVAYILMCRAKREGDLDQAQSFSEVAYEHIGRVDTSTQEKCKPILSDHMPDFFHDGIIDRALPAKTSK
jgi:hypothetical protein